MSRFAIALASLLLLSSTACTGTPPPGESTDVPVVTESPDPEVTPLPVGDPELPLCEDYYLETTEAELLASGMELLGDVSAPGQGGYGASDPALQAIMQANLSRSCTWALPASERGLTTTVTFISEEDRMAIGGILDASGFAHTTTGAEYWTRQTDGMSADLESESHAIDGSLWVATREGFGVTAPELTQQALDLARSLNL
jgi:hypothetical protein